MGFKVKETKSLLETNTVIQNYTQKGYILVSNTANAIGGSTLTFKVDETKRKKVDGLRLATWIVAIVELCIAGLFIISALVFAIVGQSMHSGNVQWIIDYYTDLAKKYPEAKVVIPTATQLKNLGLAMLTAGWIFFSLNLVALIPCIFGVKSAKTTKDNKKLLGFGIVAVVCLMAIPTGVLFFIVRNKNKANLAQKE